MRSEREGLRALRPRASRALKAKEHGKAGEASTRRAVKHAKVVQITIDAIKARKASSFRSEKELPWERRSFWEKNWHGNGEAMARGLERAKSSSWCIGREARSCVDAGLSHGEEARERRLRVIVEREASHFSKRLRDCHRPMLDRAPVKARKEESLLSREARAHERRIPWKLLRPVCAKGEREALLSRSPHVESDRPEHATYEKLAIREKREASSAAA